MSVVSPPQMPGAGLGVRAPGDDVVELDPDRSASRPPHLRVAPKVSREVLRRRRRARLAVFAVATLSAASMFVLVAFHVFAVQASFQLDKLAAERAALQKEYERRTAEVAYASAPATIFREAAALGMQMPQGVTMIHAPAAAPTALVPRPVQGAVQDSELKRSLAAGP